MPNWCHNKVEVTGPEDDVIAFVRKAQTEADEEGRAQPLSFANFIPEPDHSTSDDGAMPGWYDWRVSHWGTKWDASFGEPFMALVAEGADPSAPRDGLSIEAIGDGKSRVTYNFDTAWGPPEPVMAAASKAFPTLSIVHSYGEPGGDFGGRCVYEEGMVVAEENGTAGDFLPDELMWF